MNKKLKELAEQARFEKDEANVTVGNYKEDNEYFVADGFIEDELEKFAELIVKECMQVCLEQRDPQNLNYKPSEKFAEAVGARFGVK